jgi:hypothetical protein
LPKVITSCFESRKVIGLQVVSITGGPSFTEVEVFGHPFISGIATHLAFDLGGNFIGIVTDRWERSPVKRPR